MKPLIFANPDATQPRCVRLVGALTALRVVMAWPAGLRGGDATATMADPPTAITGSAAELSTSVRLNGTVRARNASTQVFFDHGTDGVSFPNTVAATPGTVTGDAETMVFAEVMNLPQFTTCHYRVRAVSAGGTATGAVLTFQSPVFSGLQQSFPPEPPAATGSVTVTLNNASGALAGWRFVGEKRWRPSGTTAGGLTTADYRIEFSPVPGMIQPPQEWVAIVAGDPPVHLVRDYYHSAVSGTAWLTVSLKPDSITQGLGRAQWRLLGEDETAWRDSGAVLSDLSPGSYLVECRPVSGRTTPSNAVARVVAGQIAYSTITYFDADWQTGTPPAVLPFSTVSADMTRPYAYVGQIRSDSGLSSGFVVKPRVVATTARSVWSEATYSAAQGLQWLFQRDAGTHEPKPLIPRGFYTFNAYATQRMVEDSPGDFSPQSQHLDVAALYFSEDAGRGGHGGFLASDLTDNEFLLSSAPKTLVAYPVEGVALADQGRMHATPIGNLTFISTFGRTFSTVGIRSMSGSSGGPLCVQHSNGIFCPVAIYLGGTGPTVVRAIDSAVTDLFRYAEASAPWPGWGFPYFPDPPVTEIGVLQVSLAPAGAAAAGGWRQAPESTFRPSGAYKHSLSPGTYVLQFTPLEGYLAPAAQSVVVTAGQLSQVTVTFEPSLTPQESWRQTYFGSTANSGQGADSLDHDKDGFTNLQEYTAGTNPVMSGDCFKAQNPTRGAGSFSLSTEGKAGRTYVLERSTSLAPGVWTSVAVHGPLASDATVSLTDNASPAGSAFYRLSVAGP